MKSYSQSRWLTKIPSLSSDTVLVLDKKAATNQANFNLHAYNLRDRFSAALQREQKLRELWLATSRQNKDYIMLTINQDTQIKNLEAQLLVREEEKEAITKVYKKGKRKSFIKGIGIGLVGGLVGAIILTQK